MIIHSSLSLIRCCAVALIIITVARIRCCAVALIIITVSQYCTVFNDHSLNADTHSLLRCGTHSLLRCGQMCQTPKGKITGGEAQWVCASCTLQNPADASMCAATQLPQSLDSLSLQMRGMLSASAQTTNRFNRRHSMCILFKAGCIVSCRAVCKLRAEIWVSLFAEVPLSQD